ncbi:unnamed protein product [Notodromas monacha]|uniref:Uncharacterized protein n=1 Tax=Notodromas monacha TaxID=399045 RepID=A0A7R9BPR5_9CRUS|nr:unnamed protein product [Notodromas monacha]CAG0919426.1 unnamed protein product [Notodromas monacha]
MNWLDSRVFYEHGNCRQYDYILNHYSDALDLKCEAKKKPAELKKLDNWFQKELPGILSERLPDKYFSHDEIVQCMRWKLVRGKFRPGLKELVQMNTPRVVLNETKKAYRQLTKKDDLQSAIQALSNLKGVGPAFASAILAAMAPEKIPFMADECLMAISDVGSIDYTVKEYLQFVEQMVAVCERLNKQAGSDSWNPHRVEMALWAHYVLADASSPILNELDELAKVSPLSQEKVNGNGTTVFEEEDDSRSSVPGAEENGTAEASSASSVDDESSSDDIHAVKDLNGETSNDSGVKRDEVVVECDSGEPETKRVRLEEDVPPPVA